MSERIWFDVTNSPHVFFLEPFMKHFEKKGYEVYVTTRNFYRLDQLLASRGIEYRVIGGHFGKNLAAKAIGMAHRVAMLTRTIKQVKPVACIAAGSPYAMLTSKLLGIPSAWITDNDISVHMTRFGAAYATRVFLPEHAHVEFYTQNGVKKKNIHLFKGLKEDFYLHNYKANKNYLKKIGLNGPIAVIRSEPSHAVYYNSGKTTEREIVSTLEDNGFTVVYLPRSKEEEKMARKSFPNAFIPSQALDGQNLLANADVLVGAGGSMNREAVVLGTKVLSTYNGPSLGVDEWLIEEKYMQHKPNPVKREIENFLNIKLKQYKRTAKGFDKVAYKIEQTILH